MARPPLRQEYPVPEFLSSFIDPATILAWVINLAQAGATLFVGNTVAGWAKRLTTNSLQAAKLDAALSQFLGSIARYIVLFTTLIGLNIYRGIDVACGCFSVDPEVGHIGWLLIVRNAVLLGLTALVLWGGRRRG